MEKTLITTCKNNFKSERIEAETVKIFGLEGKRVLLAHCDKDEKIISYAILTDSQSDELRKAMIYCSHDVEDVLRNKKDIEAML